MSPTNNITVPVTFVDGTEAKVRVKAELSNTELYEFLRHVGATGIPDSPSLVALCCDKKREWVDSLKRESYRRLVKECVDRNFTAAMELVADDPIAQIKMAPFLAAASEAERLLTNQATTRNSPSSGAATSSESGETLPAPSPSASVAATGESAGS